MGVPKKKWMQNRQYCLKHEPMSYVLIMISKIEEDLGTLRTMSLASFL
jgi:hypothetical protein